VDELQSRCAALHDPDLVRALTLKRRDYEKAFLHQAARELASRGIDLNAFIDHVQVRCQDQDPLTCAIGDALSRLDQEIPLWQVWTFTHCFGDSLVVQRDLGAWLVHLYEGENYRESFFVSAHDQVRRLVSLFLQLKDWRHLAGASHDLDTWKVLLRTKSALYMSKVAQVLARASIPCTVQTPVFSRDPQAQLALLVPDEQQRKATAVLCALQEEVLDLYAQAGRAFQETALTRELEVYEKLVEYGLNNPAVHYNLGSALFEAGHYSQAAESFLEAASLWLAETDTQIHFQPRHAPGGLGGLFGLVGLLFQASRLQEPRPEDHQRQVPEYVEDVEMFLERLLKHLSGDLKILHGLASIAAIRHHVPRARELYARILAIDPQDETARRYLEEPSG
jgi:tetratricopeptide (TPR) repeat protein